MRQDATQLVRGTHQKGHDSFGIVTAIIGIIIIVAMLVIGVRGLSQAQAGIRGAYQIAITQPKEEKTEASTETEPEKRTLAQDKTRREKDEQAGASAKETLETEATKPSGEEGASNPDDSGQNGAVGEAATKRVHDVVWGETLSSISADEEVSVDRLVEVNHIKDPNLIYAGSALVLD